MNGSHAVGATDPGADRPLVLHEVIDVVGQGAEPYMAHTVAFDTDAAGGRGLALMGTWYVTGSTGRWPQVVNLWELLDGWDGWARLGLATNLRRQENAALGQWWDQAYRYRTGGFDRLLGGVPGCPRPADLVAADVRGSLFVHELTRVRPGAGPEYLEAVRTERQPLLAEHGHRLCGLWEVLLTDTEVCTVWATDMASHVGLMRATDAGADPRLGDWQALARQFTTSWREELMVPAPGTPLAAQE